MALRRFSRSKGERVGDSLVLACENLETGIMANVFMLINRVDGLIVILFNIHIPRLFLNHCLRSLTHVLALLLDSTVKEIF